MRTKLETHVEILKVLALNGPSKLSKIVDKDNIIFDELSGCLNFLIKQGLVEEQTIEKLRKVYTITERGINVLKYFREIPQENPIVKARGPRKTQSLP
jgi:predicted transcriptional regulator